MGTHGPITALLAFWFGTKVDENLVTYTSCQLCSEKIRNSCVENKIRVSMSGGFKESKPKKNNVP